MVGTHAVKPERLLGPLVALIVLHSAALGLAAVVAPEWGLAFTGFGSASPLFFARQVGVFHVVVAAAYAMEWWRHRGVSVLLMAKTTAVCFLGLELARGPQPWIVPVSLVGDAAMALAVVLLVTAARRR